MSVADLQREFSIRDLASEFGVTTRTIRFYEEKGLLDPRRNGTRRIYSPADRTKLRLILRGKRLGLSLDESAEILGSAAFEAALPTARRNECHAVRDLYISNLRRWLSRHIGSTHILGQSQTRNGPADRC